MDEILGVEKDILIKAYNAENSLSDICRIAGLPISSYAFRKIKLLLEEEGLPVKMGKPGRKLKQKGYLTNKGCRASLIRTRGHRCENCGLNEWMGSPITLELEHTDGDNKNFSDENLKLLCPNCHSQTPTWRRKKKHR